VSDPSILLSPLLCNCEQRNDRFAAAAGSNVASPADPGNSLAGAGLAAEIQGRRPAAGQPGTAARAHDCAADPRAPGVSLARGSNCAVSPRRGRRPCAPTVASACPIETLPRRPAGPAYPLIDLQLSPGPAFLRRRPNNGRLMSRTTRRPAGLGEARWPVLGRARIACMAARDAGGDAAARKAGGSNRTGRKRTAARS
jgi:hypothetical protein